MRPTTHSRKVAASGLLDVPVAGKHPVPSFDAEPSFSADREFAKLLVRQNDVELECVFPEGGRRMQHRQPVVFIFQYYHGIVLYVETPMGCTQKGLGRDKPPPGNN